MPEKIESIEVFQDLFLKCPYKRRDELRQALIAQAVSPWSRAEETEEKLSEGYMAFERNSGGDIAASILTLRPESYGYKVSNILPLETAQLSISEYNDVLNDFRVQIAEPVESNNSEFCVEVTQRERSVTSWTSQEAADALHIFSIGANKSTGSSHPSDEERWFRFLIAAYKANGELDTESLLAWLTQVEEWPSDVAEDLVGQYEFGIGLLKTYDLS